VHRQDAVRREVRAVVPIRAFTPRVRHALTIAAGVARTAPQRAAPAKGGTSICFER
jgi:hypothetical protein